MSITIDSKNMQVLGEHSFRHRAFWPSLLIPGWAGMEVAYCYEVKRGMIIWVASAFWLMGVLPWMMSLFHELGSMLSLNHYNAVGNYQSPLSTVATTSCYCAYVFYTFTVCKRINGWLVEQKDLEESAKVSRTSDDKAAVFSAIVACLGIIVLSRALDSMGPDISSWVLPMLFFLLYVVVGGYIMHRNNLLMP